MVRTSNLCMSLFIAALLSIVSSPTYAARPSQLRKLDGFDLTAPLDPLDEEFLERNLQDITMAPSPARVDIVTATPTVSPVTVDLLTATPTESPDPSEFESSAPTPAVTEAPTQTNGAMGMGPPAAPMCMAAAVLVAMALIS